LPGRGVVFRDLVLGVELPLMEGYAPVSPGPGAISAYMAGALLEGYGVSVSQGPEQFLQGTLRSIGDVMRVAGAPYQHSVRAAGGALEALVRSGMGDILVRAWSEGGLTKGFIAGPRGPGEGYVRVLSRCRPVARPGWRRLVVRDVSRGIDAYEIDVPRGWRIAGRFAGDSLALEAVGPGARVRARTWNGVYGPPAMAQAALMYGSRFAPPPDPGSLLPPGGWDGFVETGAPGVHLLERMSMFAHMLMGFPGFERGVLAFSEGRAAWAWVVSYRMPLPMMGFVEVWHAGVAVSEGEYAGSGLLTLLAHARPLRGLSEARRRESTAAYRQAISSIRSSSRAHRRMMESMRRASRAGPSSGPPPRGSSYSPGDVWLRDSEEERWGDTWGGSADYYVDQDGYLRNYDSGEEIVGSVGDEGVIYDSEGNEIGYIEDGRIYDSSTGEQVGVFHPEESDEYQMGILAERTSDPDRVYGTDNDIFAPEREKIKPYYTSSKDEED